MSTRALRVPLILGVAVLMGVLVVGVATAQTDSTSFKMVRSQAAETADCLNPNANAKVTINSLGPVEVMKVTLSKMPEETGFDLFVTQVPNSPFGISWYQGDIETDENGKATQKFIGRFSIETFSVAVGSAPAPVVHDEPPFPDADTNPAFNPVHQFHLGLWFDSPKAAKAAGCPNTKTPFNGDHTAGIQALSTRNFDDDKGPLRRIK